MPGTALHAGLGFAVWTLAAAVPSLLAGIAIGLRSEALREFLGSVSGESREDPL